jgi:carboxyl-terminal processing protease
MLFRLLLPALLLVPLALTAKPERPPETVSPAATDVQARAAQLVYQFLSNSRYHYSPKPLDAAMSAQIFDRYLDSLDPERLFLLASDVERFAPHRERLDKAIAQQKLEPAFDLFSVYLERVRERTAHARAVLAGEFDFEQDEHYRFDRKDLAWESSREALDEVWRQRVKNDVLRLKLAGREMDAIRKTLDKRYATFADRVGEMKSEDVFQTFMNAYAGVLDPHTAYMNARASENFNINMSLSLEGIGAVLQREDEFTVIRSIVPGGPAAMSGQLKVGDRITAVGQGRKGPLVDIVGWRVDDVVQLIRGPRDTVVRLDVLPAELGLDGEHKLVAITRDKVKLEEQAAKKTIIEVAEGDANRRIGVITLPTFYQDFEARRRTDPDYRSATRDVERLLLELKAAQVDGVLLDLRNNGGGSLAEAVALTGLFIDSGPVVQVRQSSGNVTVETDRNPGVAWDGPLAVLVNRASASASEIFAAAVQDYGRGVIIGEPTYGKGTVQNLVDLDFWARSETPALGQLKLTIAQFFRISGGSTQHRGVEPDIAFPITLDAQEYGESALDNALPWSEIAPSRYETYGNLAPLTPLLLGKHQARVADDREFQYWVEDVAEYRTQRARKSISLNKAERVAERERNEQRRQQREAERKAAGEAADNLAAAQAALDDGLQADERRVVDQVAAEEASKEDGPDTLLREAAHVLADAIWLLGTDRALAARVFPGRDTTTRVE